MTASARSLTKRPAWEALAVHHNKVKGLHLRDLFSADHKRGERLTAEATGLFLDYSKNRVTDETLKLLVATGVTLYEIRRLAKVGAARQGERVVSHDRPDLRRRVEQGSASLRGEELS